MIHDRPQDMSQSEKTPDKAKGTADFYAALEQLEDVLEGADALEPEADPQTPDPPLAPSPSPAAPSPSASALYPDRQAHLALLEDAIADLESFLHEAPE